MKTLSVVIPCYNEQESLPLFYEEIVQVALDLEQLRWELIFVDDGSGDDTLAIMTSLAKEDPRVTYLSFSRNFGKEAAIFAGLTHSTGDYVVLIDADLQHPPRLIKEMYEAIQDGYDCAATRRVTRTGEPVIRSFFARSFYKIMNKMNHFELVDGAQDFRMMTRQVVHAVLSMSERNRFSKGIFSWVGYKTKWIEHENVKRVSGESKWSFFALFKYSIEGMVAFSTVPLFISSLVGFLMCIGSFVGILVVFIQYFMGIQSAFGWSSMVTVILFLSGIQLFSIGILGQYLAKTYIEVKNRPLYIIKEENQNNAAVSPVSLYAEEEVVH